MSQEPISTGDVELKTSCYSTLSGESAETDVSGSAKEEERGRTRIQRNDAVMLLAKLETLATLKPSASIEPQRSGSFPEPNLSAGASTEDLSPAHVDGPAMLKASLDLFMKSESPAGLVRTSEDLSRVSSRIPVCGSNEALKMRTPTNSLQDEPPYSRGKITHEECPLSTHQEDNDVETAQLFEELQEPSSGYAAEVSAETCVSSPGNHTPASKERVTIRDRVPTPIPHATDSERSRKSDESPSENLDEDFSNLDALAKEVAEWDHHKNGQDQPFRQFFARLKVAVRRRHEKTLHRAKTFKTMITEREPRAKRNSTFAGSFYSGLRSNTRSRSKTKLANFQDALSVFEDNASNEFQLHLDSLCSSKINLALDFDLNDVDMLEACEPQAEAIADKLYPWKTRTCSSEIIMSPVESPHVPYKPESGKRSGIVGSITNFWPSRSSKSSERAPTTGSSADVFEGLDVACNF